MVCWQWIAEPGHGAIHVMQIEVVFAIDEVVGFPALAGPITAGGAQAMQDGKEEGAFDGEIEGAVGQELAKDLLATGLLPEALKDERGADMLARDRWHLTTFMGGQEQDMFSETSAGGEQAIELAGLL